MRYDLSVIPLFYNLTPLVSVPLFSDFPLDPAILKTLQEIGFKEPTPIQAASIPPLLEGKDLLASAQTGTGKTAAFLLPLIHKIAHASAYGAYPQALILVPTRELALQVAEAAKQFTRHHPHIKTVCVFGGVPYPVQRKALSKRFSILVATPGRLIDHIEQGRINLGGVQTLILDEADRMLDMGFIDPVEHIASLCPVDRQTLLFSATLDHKILPLSKRLQKDATQLRMTPTDTAKKNIEQRLYIADDLNHKERLLARLLETGELKQTIVFTSTKRQADQLARKLEEKGTAVRALHGDMRQRQRTRTVEDMRRGHFDVLVATDVAGRGIDIPTLSHVVNFDLPNTAEDFIHRIGRTGRAGAKGTAISFASHREKRNMGHIEKQLGSPIAIHTLEGLEPKFQDSPRPSGPRRPGNNFGPRRFGGPNRPSFGKKRHFPSGNR